MRILLLYLLTGIVLGNLPTTNMPGQNAAQAPIVGVPLNAGPTVPPLMLPQVATSQGAPVSNPLIPRPAVAPTVPMTGPPNVSLQQPNATPQAGARLIPPISLKVPSQKSVRPGSQNLSYSQKIGLDMIYKQIREVLEEDRQATNESLEVKLGREWMAQFPDSPFNSELGKKLAQMERARKAQLNLKLYLLMEQKKSILNNSKKIHLKEDLVAKQKRLRREYKSLMQKFVTFFHKIQNMSTKKIKAELNQTMNRISEQNREILSKNLLLQNTLNQKLDTRVNRNINSTSSTVMNKNALSQQQNNMSNMVNNASSSASNSRLNNSSLVNNGANLMSSSQVNMSNKNTVNNSSIMSNRNTENNSNVQSNKNVVNNSNIQSNKIHRNVVSTSSNIVNKTSKNINSSVNVSKKTAMKKSVEMRAEKTEKQLKSLETKLEKRFAELKKAATQPIMMGCGCGGCCSQKKCDKKQKNEEEKVEEEQEEEEQNEEESKEDDEKSSEEKEEEEKKGAEKKTCKTVIQTICEEETDSKTAKAKVAKAKARKALQAKKIEKAKKANAKKLLTPKKPVPISALRPTYQLGPCGCRPGIT